MMSLTYCVTDIYNKIIDVNTFGYEKIADPPMIIDDLAAHVRNGYGIIMMPTEAIVESEFHHLININDAVNVPPSAKIYCLGKAEILFFRKDSDIINTWVLPIDSLPHIDRGTGTIFKALHTGNTVMVIPKNDKLRYFFAGDVINSPSRSLRHALACVK